MNSDLEERVRSAYTEFVATVVVAAERTAVDAVRSAFAQVSRQFSLSFTMPADSPAKPRDRRHRPTADERASRVIDSVRAHPGASATELEPHVGIKVAALRRYLAKMAKNGSIQFVETPSTRGPARRTYFVPDAQPNGVASGTLGGAGAASGAALA
jgi:hypothetical protein